MFSKNGFFLLVCCLTWTNLIGQFSLTNSSKYYEKEFERRGIDGCWTSTFDQAVEEEQNLVALQLLVAVDNLRGMQEGTNGMTYFLGQNPDLYWPFVDTGDIRSDSIDNAYAHPIDPTERAQYLDTIQFRIEQTYTKWEKKKTDRNCLSADPNDCLVWCLVTKPYTDRDLIVVTDTSKVKNFRTVLIQLSDITNLGKTYSRRILCPEEIDGNLVKKVQQRLIELGFMNARKKKKYDQKLRTALNKFQEEYGLPKGFLDHPTLEYLDVEK